MQQSHLNSLLLAGGGTTANSSMLDPLGSSSTAAGGGVGAVVGASSPAGVVGPLSSLSVTALLPLSPVNKNLASSVFAQDGQPLFRSHSDHAAYLSLNAKQMPLTPVSESGIDRTVPKDEIQGDESGTALLEKLDGTKTPRSGPQRHHTATAVSRQNKKRHTYTME